MKNFILRSVACIGVLAFFLSAARAEIPVPNEPGVVGYNPVVKIAQGNQPYAETYQLLITMPANLTSGVSIPVALSVTPMLKPLGVSDATAAGYVTLSATNVVVSQPSQVVSVTVSISVPVGSAAGGYSWKVTTSGWPASLGVITDIGHTINGLFSAVGAIDTSPPAITLNSPANGTVYTYYPASGSPVTVPVNFAASVGTNGAAITGLTSFISGTPVVFTSTGLNTLSATGAGSVQLTAAGNYTVSANATNINGTSTASADISVVISAPPPTVTGLLPANNATYSFAPGGSVTVPVSCSAVSAYGNVTALSATLNGSPLSLALTGVGSATTATGTTSLSISSAGTYSLVFSATNAYGAATPVTVNFTVTSVIPVPTVAILTPANGTVFTRVAGSPATVVNYTFAGGTTYNKVTSVNVTLDGAPVSPTVVGLNTASITGTGSASFSAGGSHTLTVTLSNGGASATASTTFTVNQTQPPVCRNLIWLQPISLNKTIQGGTTMPIYFNVSYNGQLVRDTNVVIAIYELYRDGTVSPAVLYPYGPGSNANPPDYAIAGYQYQLNFATAPGTHSYQIDVYTTVSGSVVMLGSKVLNTSKDLSHDCSDHRHDRNNSCDRDDRFDDGDNSCWGGHW